MKKLLITAFALLAFAAGSQAQTNDKNAKNMKTIALTKADFLKKVANYEKNPEEWKYLGDKPALIDFYASWCGPCKALAPVLEELAAEYGDRIYIYKINTEEEQELAAAFGIRSIPTLLFIPVSYTHLSRRAPSSARASCWPRSTTCRSWPSSRVTRRSSNWPKTAFTARAPCSKRTP